MKKSLCASTAALALVLASAMLAPAFGADLSIAPIYKAPAASWAGSYVGIAGGGAWGSALLRNTGRMRPGSPTCTRTRSPRPTKASEQWRASTWKIG